MKQHELHMSNNYQKITDTKNITALPAATNITGNLEQYTCQIFQIKQKTENKSSITQT
jgi:hypothetical protein